jgi:hypothetical protein
MHSHFGGKRQNTVTGVASVKTMDKKAMAYQTTHSNNLPEWLAKIYVCSEV